MFADITECKFYVTCIHVHIMRARVLSQINAVSKLFKKEKNHQTVRPT